MPALSLAPGRPIPRPQFAKGSATFTPGRWSAQERARANSFLNAAVQAIDKEKTFFGF